MRHALLIATALALACLAMTGSALADDAPATAITAGPAGTSVLTMPRFDFIANKAATFECSLDGAPFASCGSPHTVGPLALGSHTFTVRATGTDGVVESSPPSRQWLVVPALTSPIVKLTQPAKRALAIRSMRTLAGTAQAPSGVKRVQVALSLGGPDRNFFPPRCAFVDLRSGRPAPQACLLPRYFAAKGTTSWRYAISARARKRLLTGRYTLTVRAFNAYNQATQQRYTLTLR